MIQTHRGVSVSELKSKDTLLIVKNAKKEETHGATIFRIDLPYLVKFEEGLIGCSKYNRSNDYAQCSEFDADDGTGTTRVIGLDYER